jgi:hypothetical protein
MRITRFPILFENSGDYRIKELSGNSICPYPVYMEV